MSKRIALLIAIVVFAAVVMYDRQVAVHTPDYLRIMQEHGDAPVTTPPPEVAESGDDAVLEPAPAVAEPLYVISGFVRDEAGEVLAGINLQAYRLNASGARAAGQSLYTSTDDKGYFQFELDHPHGHEIVAESNWSFREFSIQTAAVSRVIHIALSRIQGAAIYGRIENNRGGAIAGALVTNGSGETQARSDERGEYLLEIDLPNAHLPVVSVFRAGYESQHHSIRHEAFAQSARVERNIVLEESALTTVVSGHLKNPLGEGIPDLRLRLHSLPFNLIYTTYSDHNGDFAFEGVRVDTTYRLEIERRDPYSGLDRHAVLVTRDMPPWHLILEPVITARIAGQLLDGNSNALPKFSIAVLSPDTPGFDRDIVTDEFGRFEIDRFPVGPIVFRTRRPPHFKVTGLVVDANTGNDFTVPIDFGLQRVFGQVTNARGIALAGVRITLERSESAGGVEQSSLRTIHTSELGYFDFTGVNTGRHRITVYAEGSESVEAFYLAGVQTEPIDLVVD